MHPYIPHLLDDILNAHRTEQLPEKIFSTPTFEEEMEEIERWCEGEEPAHTSGFKV